MPAPVKSTLEVIHPPVTAVGVSLREYVDTRLAHIVEQAEERRDLEDKALKVRFEALDMAVALAREMLDVRLATTNEWRKTVDDILKTAVTQNTYNADVGRLQLDVVEAKAMSALMVRREEYAGAIDDVKKSIGDLQISRATLAGKAEQSAVNVAMILSVVGLLLGGVGVILSVVGG